MFQKYPKREVVAFALALGLVAFVAGRAISTLPHPTVHSAETRAQVPPTPQPPAEAKPAEAKPAEAKPAEAKPAVAKPAEAKPTEAKPAEAKPAEAKPAVAKPAVAKPVQPKPVAPRPAPTTPPGESAAVDFRALGESPAQGPDEPLVVFLTCTDFQCPVCARAANEMRPIMDKYKDRVRFELKNNALRMHKQAEPAAIAGLAAHRQGKFWHMHDAMFRQMSLIRGSGDSGLAKLARTIGANVERFTDDIQDPALRAQVRAESAMCAALGAAGTPAFFINGERHVGWASAMAMERNIQRHIAFAEKELAAGTPRTKLHEALARKHATEPNRYIAMVIRHAMPDLRE